MAAEGGVADELRNRIRDELKANGHDFASVYERGIVGNITGEPYTESDVIQTVEWIFSKLGGDLERFIELVPAFAAEFEQVGDIRLYPGERAARWIAARLCKVILAVHPLPAYAHHGDSARAERAKAFMAEFVTALGRLLCNASAYGTLSWIRDERTTGDNGTLADCAEFVKALGFNYAVPFLATFSPALDDDDDQHERPNEYPYEYDASDWGLSWVIMQARTRNGRPLQSDSYERRIRRAHNDGAAGYILNNTPLARTRRRDKHFHDCHPAVAALVDAPFLNPETPGTSSDSSVEVLCDHVRATTTLPSTTNADR